MNIHEYQAKQIFRKYHLPTPKGFLANSVNETIVCAKKLGGKKWVLKAQVHTGGRGKAGGIKIANSLEEVKKYADELLGMTLVTKQTGPAGIVVQKIYIEEGVTIAYEAYLGITLDRSIEMPVLMGSRDGGVEIEKVALENPNSIKKSLLTLPLDLKISMVENWHLSWEFLKMTSIILLILLERYIEFTLKTTPNLSKSIL